MSSSSTHLVPPTTHTIPEPDRQRLVRSIRKIGSVLGETPVVESETATKTMQTQTQLLTPSTAGSGKRGFFSQASASLSSLSLNLPLQRPESPAGGITTTASLHAAPERDERPSLVLRLPSNSTLDVEPPTPLSPVMSPLSPVARPEQETRRLRLAKVSRTLGEAVPPSLIVSAPSASAQVKRRRRASSLVMPESKLEFQQFARRGGIPEEEGARRTRRDSMRSLVSFIDMDMPNVDAGADATDAEPEPESSSPLGEVHVHPVPFSPDTDGDAHMISARETGSGEWLRPVSRTPSRASSIRRSRSISPGPAPSPEPTLALPPTPPRSASPSPSMFSRMRTPEPPSPAAFADFAAGVGMGAPPSYDESHAHGPAPTQRSYVIPPLQAGASGAMLRRDEGEWSGEWSSGGGAVGNMEDVMRGLRGLRVRS